MAISFQRPDPASPASISAAQFPTSRRGFDQAEVRDFLRMVAAEQARLQERERFLERELKAAQQHPSGGLDGIDEETVTRMLGEEAARVLQTAREAAAQIKQRAEEAAARLLREATDEGQRLREEAEIEAARRRQDAAADSEAELSMAKQQGRDMVNEARAYRERVLSELARRRELARQQIEQLIHGRDRLLQAFERSRLAAVEVMAELTPLGEPNEYVNLTPTTGPVPMMVPSSTAPAGPGTSDATSPGIMSLMRDDDDEPTMPMPVVTDATAVADDDDVSERADWTPRGGLRIVGPDETAPPANVDASTDGEASTEETSVVADARASDAGATSVAEPAEAHETSDESSASGTSGVGAPDESTGTVDVAGDGPADESTDDAVDAAADHSTDVAAANDANDADEEPGAEVVALFGADVDAPDIEDAIDADAPGVVAPGVDDEADARVAATKPVGATVEDLFARLRAARAETVAKSVELDVDAPTDGSSALTIDDADAAPIEVVPVDEVIVPIIVSAARKLKRVLADEQNELLDTLRRKEPIRSLDVLLPWESDQSARYAAAVEADLLASSSAGAQGNENGRNPAIVRPALDAITNEIVAPLRDRLIRCIDKADGDNTELANQVRLLYREWKNQRIDDQVEAIIRLAYDRGSLTVASR